MSWTSVKLAEVAEIERKSIDPSNIESGTEYLGLEHIEKGGRIIGWQTVSNGELASTKFHFGPNHVLYGKLRPYLGKIALPDFEGVCSTDILPIMPGPKIDRKFLAYFLRQPAMVDFATSRSAGANLPRLSPKALAEFEIPLPSLDEQRRIAGILDQANAIRALRTHSIDRLNKVGQSTFYEMFGDPAVNSHQWPIGTIRDLIAEARYGTAKKAHTEARGIPILRMGNITYEGEINLEDLKYVELADKEIEKYTVRKGDIIFNRTNSKDLVGKTAVYNSDNQMAIAGYLVRARVNERADPYYIRAYLNSKHGKSTLRNMCKNIVGMANINAQEFQNIPISIPPIELQREYRDKIEGLADCREYFQRSSSTLEYLFDSLQQRAFRGEL